MSLAKRLSAVIPSRSNSGCLTCAYLNDMDRLDRQAFDQWLADKNSATQLWEVCTAEGLTISFTAFRNHLRHHRAVDEC